MRNISAVHSGRVTCRTVGNFKGNPDTEYRFQFLEFKELVQPTLKIQSLSTHPYGEQI